MKVIAQIKLSPTKEQYKALKQTLQTANAACNKISTVAWKRKIFQKAALQKIVYRKVRDKFGLSAQLTVRCIAKVTDAYKLDKKKKRVFKKHGSIAYDSRILTYFTKRKEVSIWLLEMGRVKIPFRAGKRQRVLLKYQQGESDLVFFRGEWYLYACCNAEEPEPYKPKGGIIGVDLGVENIAVTSDGGFHSSVKLEQVREWYHNRRAILQSVGTKSAKRRLKQLSKRQRNFQKDINHKITKNLVREAKRTKRGIALEDLKGINTRTRVRKKDRAKRFNWSFYQFRAFVTYKAKWTGVPLYFVNPRYTSQRCNECTHTSKKNRQTQSQFKCVSCGYKVHADLNGSFNIRDLGAIQAKGRCLPSYGADGSIRRKSLASARGG